MSIIHNLPIVNDKNLEIMSENVETSGTPQRPTMLTVLCILSFIASGIGIIGMIIAGTAKGVVESAGGSSLLDQAMDQNPELYDTPEMADAMSQVESAFSWPSMIITTVLILISLYGVIKMWNLKKQGFMIYAGAGVAALIVPLIFGQSFSIFSLVVTAIFIALYYTQTKVMS